MEDTNTKGQLWIGGIMIALALLLIGYFAFYSSDALQTEAQDNPAAAASATSTIGSDNPASSGSSRAATEKTPSVKTIGFASVSSTTAVVVGSVVPGGAETTYWFEYGTTAQFGSIVNARSAGAGLLELGAAGYLTGLKPATEYYFRIGAQNAYGRVYGGPYKFITEAK